MFRGIRVIVDREHINHVMDRKGRRSVEANQVRWDLLWGMVERHALGS